MTALKLQLYLLINPVKTLSKFFEKQQCPTINVIKNAYPKMVLKLTCQAEKESGLTYIYEHKLEEVLSLSSQDSLRSTKQYR